MRNLSLIFLLLSCFTASAADRITATISVTNAPLGNTNTLVVNGSTRTFTNSVTGSPATLIQQTNSIPWSATNILSQITDYRFSQFHFLSQTASTNFLIVGAVGEALTVTLAGAWGNVVYSTQTVSSPTFIVRVPMTVEQTSNRTHIASLLVQGQSDNSTNSFATNAVAMSNYVTKGASALQQVSSPLQVSGQLGVSIASMTNVSLYNATNRGYVVALTNGIATNLTLLSPKSTNLINYGNALSSSYGATGGEQFGSGAVAAGINATAIGRNATASAVESAAFGYGASAIASSATAVGDQAGANGPSTTVMGYASTASTNYSGAFGASSTVSGERSYSFGYNNTLTHSNTVLVGNQQTSTGDNQIEIGSSAQTVKITGVLSSATSTNGTFKGTNIFNSQVVFTPTANTGLANGYNAAVAIGAAYVRFSGPSAAYTNAGFSAANKMDGKMHFCQFDNPGLSMTFLHDSGLDPGNSTNRIYTGTGALVNSTNRVVHVIMSYDDAVTAWRIWSFR